MIYFVRHGETDFNLFNISQGQLDVSLNALGLKQAKEVAKKLKNKKFDVFYCSTLTRAKQTAEEINKYLKMKIKYDARLMEVSKGVLQGNKNSQKTYNRFFKNPHKYGGETEEDVCLRTYSFLNDIQKYKGKNILIVGHGGIHKYLNFCLNKHNIKTERCVLLEMNKYKMKNCEVAKFKF